MSDQQPDERETLQPDGEAVWSGSDIERLSTITPAVIADVRADARRDPVLNALLRAVETDAGRE